MVCSFLPKVNKCCGCVLDLKTASAIIAVLGIVTSPAVSWAIVRHSYVIRVSCYITSNANRPDVVDIQLSNIISFGFGVNAGLGPSCLQPIQPQSNQTINNSSASSSLLLRTTQQNNNSNNNAGDSNFVTSVRWVGWIVLTADIIFLGYSIYFLFRLFKPAPDGHIILVATQFMWSCIVAILLSFVYSMMYVASCIKLGGSFPIFEFFFAVVDIVVWSMWIYFIIVVRSHIINLKNALVIPSSTHPIGWWDWLWNRAHNFWAYFIIVVNSYSTGSGNTIFTPRRHTPV